MQKAGSRTARAKAAPVYQVLTVPDLSGGVDLRSSPTLMGPTRARRCHNFALSEPGSLPVYPGNVQFSSASLGTTRAQGAQRVYLSSNVFTLGAYGGAVYRPTDAGVWGSTVCSSRSSSNEVYFPYDRDLVAVFDGDNRPLKSGNAGAGSSWTLMGINAPSSGGALSSLASTTGTLLSTNEYEVTCAYADDELGHESIESSVVSTYTMGSSGALKVTVANSSDNQVDTIYVYARNKTAGESIRRRSITITQASTSGTSTGRITSSGWLSNAEAPTNRNVPLAFAFGVIWKNRWWARHPTIGNRLHFTEIFQPQSWPTLYYIDIPFERGDSIRAMIAQGDMLLVFGNTKPYLIIGQTSLDFEVKPALGAQAGALGPRAVAALESGIIHVDRAGVWIFDGASDRLLSYDIETAWRDFVTHASQADLNRVGCVYHALRKELRIAVSRLYPTADAGEWVLDLNRTRQQEQPAWFSTPRPIGGYMSWDGPEPTAGNYGRLFSWDSTRGVLHEEATGTTDNSSNMVANYDGPAMTAGRFMTRWIDGAIEYKPSGGAAVVELVVDGKSVGSQTVDIGSGVYAYGSSGTTYGTALYGGATRGRTPIVWPLESEGLAAQIKIQYTGQDAYVQYGYEQGLVPEPDARGM